MVQAHPGWDLLTSPPLSPHPVIASQAKQSLSIVILAYFCHSRLSLSFPRKRESIYLTPLCSPSPGRRGGVKERGGEAPS
jgi:hypothetical protein